MLVLLVVAACIAAVFTVLAAQHLFPRGGPNLDEVAYDAQARALVDMFNKNFAKFEIHVDADVKAAAPALRQAAE